MKRIIYLACTLLLPSALILSSCKKDDNSPDETILPGPTLDLIGNIGFVSNDAEMSVNAEFNVGVVATNSGSGKNLVSFIVVRTFMNIPDTVVNHSFSSPVFSWESSFNANQYIGKEEWVFCIKDENGKTANLFFTITTLDLTPIISFNGNTSFVSGDTSMIINSEFNVGIAANSVGGKNLVSFIVVRNFMSIPDTVADHSFSSPEFSWDSAFNANANIGNETWFFSITDEDGETADLYFVITTTSEEIAAFLNVNMSSFNDNSYGNFFSTSTGLVYFRNEATQNQELIDFAFYIGVTNHTTLGAPSNIDVIEVYNLVDWTTFNTTLFQEAPVTADEFDDIGSNYTFPSFTGGEDDINFLEFGDVVFFKTENEKLGFIKVNSINEKGDVINIDVKVMQ